MTKRLERPLIRKRVRQEPGTVLAELAEAGPEEVGPSAPNTRHRLSDVGRFFAVVCVVGTGCAAPFIAYYASSYLGSGPIGAGKLFQAADLLLSLAFGPLFIPALFVLPVILAQWALGKRGDLPLGAVVGVVAGLIAEGCGFILVFVVTSRSYVFAVAVLWWLALAMTIVACVAAVTVGLPWMLIRLRAGGSRLRVASGITLVGLTLFASSFVYLTDLETRFMAVAFTEPTAYGESSSLGRFGEPLEEIGPNGLQMSTGQPVLMAVPYALGAAFGIMMERKRYGRRVEKAKLAAALES